MQLIPRIDAVLTQRSLAIACGLFAAVAGPIPALAEKAGEVVFVQGLTTAQRSGAVPRFVAKGDVLEEGDMITTGTRGFAVIGLRDGAKFTLRPNTERPITVTLGSNHLTNLEKLLEDVQGVLSGPERRGQVPPLWDGHTAERTLKKLIAAS